VASKRRGGSKSVQLGMLPPEGVILKNKLILRLSGKARQVFPMFDLFVKQQGNKRLGQIIKEKGG